jgi:hypothetical protein
MNAIIIINIHISIIITKMETFGTFLTDIAWDYQQLREELATLTSSTTDTTTVPMIPPPTVSQKECLFLEMELGIVGTSS